jgi:hypothetical protein
MEPHSVESLVSAQRALRSRFDDFLQALRHKNRTALEITLFDFDQQLRRWTEAEEASLVAAVERAGVAGRDPRRELRLEFVQLRELTGFIANQIAAGIRAHDLTGYVENLDRRLRAHEEGLRSVYYPAASNSLTEGEWAALLAARPEP